MSDKTGIEWTQGDDGTPGATWNPVTGCERISPGCDHCYALTFAERWRGVKGHYFEHGFDVQLRPDKLGQPLRWKRPRRIFVNSMSDLFHKDVPDEYIARVWDVMGQTPQHTYMILTKRHARMRSWVSRWADRTGDRSADKPSGMPAMPRGPEAVRAAYASGRGRLFADMLDSMGKPPEGCAYPLYDWMEGQRWWPAVLPNVWLGVSAEDQHWADIRIPALLDTPAAVRFISAEPLLGPLSFWPDDHAGHERDDAGEFGGQAWTCLTCSGQEDQEPRIPWRACDRSEGIGVDWVIAGGESGAGARPCTLTWLRDLRDECAAANVPFFAKQLGAVLGRQLGAGSKGGDMDRWPEDLRIREFPRVPSAVSA